ncbi:unnamed protein product [Microthlaspi erraticum]|uniref:Uncharacterized protein n=1 Tax=Microthlaspi erraticum TaxID=1685480 RepID=A0A6D2LN41_9BRAS|nr:unnamed protein product [Microthlaspi erraticum]
MTLFPTKFENGKIEYKIRYKGRSRPFSRAKALVTSEQSRDPTKLKELLSQVLTITLDGVKGASSTDSSIELETRATRSSYTTRPRKQVQDVESEGSKQLQKEGEKQEEERKEQDARIWKGDQGRRTSRGDSLRSSLRGELREEKENQEEGMTHSSESEQGEFEIGVNLVQEEKWSPSEKE